MNELMNEQMQNRCRGRLLKRLMCELNLEVHVKLAGVGSRGVFVPEREGAVEESIEGGALETDGTEPQSSVLGYHRGAWLDLELVRYCVCFLNADDCAIVMLFGFYQTFGIPY